MIRMDILFIDINLFINWRWTIFMMTDWFYLLGFLFFLGF
jgi:hypothetical protein